LGSGVRKKGYTAKSDASPVVSPGSCTRLPLSPVTYLQPEHILQHYTQRYTHADIHTTGTGRQAGTVSSDLGGRTAGWQQ